MCETCEARQKAARDAFVNWKIAEAVKQLALGAVEMVGMKEKPDGAGLQLIRGSMDEADGSADAGGLQEGGGASS